MDRSSGQVTAVPLTADDCRFLLELIATARDATGGLRFGRGWSSDGQVGRIQAALSIGIEAASKSDDDKE